MKKKKCKLVKPNGDKCKAWAIINSKYCIFHEPSISEEERTRIKARAGRGNRRNPYEVLESMALKGGTDISFLLAETINKIRAGKMDLKVAGRIGYLAGHLLRAFEVSDLDKRIAKIEKALEQRGIKD